MSPGQEQPAGGTPSCLPTTITSMCLSLYCRRSPQPEQVLEPHARRRSSAITAASPGRTRWLAGQPRLAPRRIAVTLISPGTLTCPTAARASGPDLLFDQLDLPVAERADHVELACAISWVIRVTPQAVVETVCRPSRR